MIDAHVFNEQQLLRTTLRDVMNQSVPGLVERSAPASRRAAAAELWELLTSLDMAGLGIEERHGGMDASIIEQVVVARELGRALAPTSTLTSAVAGGLLRTCRQEAAEALLRSLASGTRAAVALQETAWAPRGHPEPALALELALAEEAVVSGELFGVIDAEGASRLVIAVDDGSSPTETRVVLVETSQSGVENVVTNEIAMIRSFSTVALTGISATVCNIDRAQARRAIAEGRLLLTYEMLGACEAVLDLAADYATHRTQFGRPIGTFQAVSHRLASAYIELQAAAASAAHALRAHETPMFELLARLARETASVCLTNSCEAAVQVHGAIAYTWEHVLHHYLKYAKTCERMLDAAPTIQSEMAAFAQQQS